MAMTNATMAPAVDSKVLLTKAQLDQAAALAAKAQADAEEEKALLDGTKTDLDAEVKAESAQLKAAFKSQEGLKDVCDLTEADAYNLDVGIQAGAMANSDALKVRLKDPNYIARWGNRNSVRQSQLIGQGYRVISPDEVTPETRERLEMFINGQRHFVYSDLIAMKIPKNVYYAGLRRAYLKSLHATNSRKASEAGAIYAKSDLNSSLRGSEKSYMASHEETKPIYNPSVGV
jgi:hypothetical protein